LLSNISRQGIKIERDGNSGDMQDFGFDFQENLSIDGDREQIDYDDANDTALAGSGDTEEYEIPDWALKPV
jgi:hypothetical protein